MHMDGFRSAFEDSTPPCINLYVADWTLSSVGKYVGGMFGAFFVGLLVECTSFVRKYVHRRRRDMSWKWERMGLVFLHFVQSVLGYLAMFAAMTYSIGIVRRGVWARRRAARCCTWTTRRQRPRTRGCQAQDDDRCVQGRQVA